MRSPSTRNLARSRPSRTKLAVAATLPEGGVFTRCPSSRSPRPASARDPTSATAPTRGPAVRTAAGRRRPSPCAVGGVQPAPDPADAVLRVDGETDEPDEPVLDGDGEGVPGSTGLGEVGDVPGRLLRRRDLALAGHVRRGGEGVEDGGGDVGAQPAQDGLDGGAVEAGHAGTPAITRAGRAVRSAREAAV